MKNKINSPKLTQIIDFTLGKKIKGFFLCYEKSYKISKTGTPYLDILLSDNSGKIVGRVWDNADHFNEKFSKGDPVAVKGISIDFNNQIQLNVNQINIADHKIYDKYGFNPENLMITISENPNKLLYKIETILNKIKSVELKKLCINVFSKFKNDFGKYPASINNHYPVKGGLLLHISNCLNLCLQFIKNYNYLDKDLLISGTFLHDIGKVKSYYGEYIFEETTEVKLYGHEILGLIIVKDEINQIEKFPEELKQKLFHIILEHHKKVKDGCREWQRFPEALAVFNINRSDAQLDIMNRVFLNSKDNHLDWTSGKHHFNTSLFNK